MAVILVTEEAIPPVYRFSLTEKLAIELAERGVKVYLVCRKGDREFSHPGVFYHPVFVKNWSLFNLKKRIEANLRLVLKIWEIMRKDDIKLVYGWWPVLFFARMAGSTVVADMPEFIDVMYRSFNKPFPFLISPLLRFFQKTVAKISKMVITESDIARAVWASRGIDYKKTISLPYGVDVDFFISARRDETFKREYGIEEDEKVIMYHGDIGIDDGVDILIKATEDIDTKVVIIGDGDPHYMKYLKNMAHRNVIFTGWIPYKKIPGILKNADVYVAPFRSSLYTNSTFPLKIMEAMAAGRVVVVSKLNAFLSYLKDEVNCLLVEPGDVEELREKILKFFLNPQDREMIEINATKKAREKFDWRIRINIECEKLLEFLGD